jgi:hypothetical protein
MSERGVGAMKTKRVITQRGVKYDALAEGYKILKLPLAGAFSAAAEHFSESDPPFEEGEKKTEPDVKGTRAL